MTKNSVRGRSKKADSVILIIGGSRGGGYFSHIPPPPPPWIKVGVVLRKINMHVYFASFFWTGKE